MHPRNDFREISFENNDNRPNEANDYIETFSIEFILRFSQELDSMMVMMKSQVNQAISSATSDRVIPEMKNIMSSMFSSGNWDTGASSSPNSQENRRNNLWLKTKITKKTHGPLEI